MREKKELWNDTHTHKNIYHLTLESFGYENIHHIISVVFWPIKSVSFNKKEESGGIFPIKATKPF